MWGIDHFYEQEESIDTKRDFNPLFHVAQLYSRNLLEQYFS